MASADRMREVADIVCSFPEHLPVVVLSAMGKVGRRAARGAPGGDNRSSSSTTSLCPVTQLLPGSLACGGAAAAPAEPIRVPAAASADHQPAAASRRRGAAHLTRQHCFPGTPQVGRLRLCMHAVTEQASRGWRSLVAVQQQASALGVPLPPNLPPPCPAAAAGL